MSWLNSAAVCERYQIGPRSIYRWTTNDVLPPPVRINGRKYWRLEDLEAYDEARLAVAQPTARQMIDGRAA